MTDAPIRPGGAWVLYWMIAARRTTWNQGLERAASLAEELRRPLVILEALRCNYPWASDRLHRFVIQGMAASAAALTKRPVTYYPYVEPRRGAGMGLLEALAEQACAVVTDEFPCFFLPGMVERVGRAMPVRFEAVDSNGLLPLRSAETTFPTAYAFRRFLQKSLRPHLARPPQADPLADRSLPRLKSLPAEILKRWPAADERMLAAGAAALANLPIDHGVGAAAMEGGSAAAMRTLDSFLDSKLERYAEERSEPEKDAASGLSPYLHFGHISAWQVVAEVMKRERWSAGKLSESAAGKREGWWGMSSAAESFLDELITWRELGYNFCHHRADYDRYESLPDWAQASLDRHASDPRPKLYSREQFERATTHDGLWNAAQTQLVREGRMHNYLRMLWGKKILEWSASPRAALATMIDLNNRYAVDGRNPNSYSGIFWVLGRFDRPWAPQRPIFGCIRYMSSENTARKFDVKGYMRRYAADGPGTLWG